MKKLISALILLTFAVSCMVSDDEKPLVRYDSLENVARDIVNLSATFAVNTLCALSEEPVYINAEGFRHQCVKELETRPRIIYDFVRVGDRLWEVTASGNTLNFTLRVSLDSDDPRNGRWTVSPFTLDYDEGFGYSAVISARDDISLYYIYHRPGFLFSGGWQLCQNGTYEVRTFINGKEADSCILEY